MASGVGTKSRAPDSTSSMSLGICCVMSRDERSNGVAPAFVRLSCIGSVRMLVRVSLIGAGMETNEGGRSDSMPGIGVGSDFSRLMSDSSDGTLPMEATNIESDTCLH